MVRQKLDYSKLIVCECGCGTEITQYNKWGYKRRFISGHNTGDQTLSNNRSWKGGYIDNKGYRRLGRKYKAHRYVYEQYHKCCLMPYTDVHHKDGNKLNNDISNLETLMHSEHSLLSWRKRKNITNSRYQ
jgi:hypothetical protein